MSKNRNYTVICVTKALQVFSTTLTTAADPGGAGFVRPLQNCLEGFGFGTHPAEHLRLVQVVDNRSRAVQYFDDEWLAEAM